MFYTNEWFEKRNICREFFFPVISKEVYDNIRAKLLDLASHNEILMKSKAST